MKESAAQPAGDGRESLKAFSIPGSVGFEKNVKNVDDLLYIKSLVAERVREGGTLILNADDERLARLPEARVVSLVPKEIVFFSLDAENPVIRRHIAEGLLSYFVNDGSIVEARGDYQTEIVRVIDLPVTMHGAADYQTADVMAAIAACRAHGLSRDAVAAAMKRFSNVEHNAGRGNHYRVGGGYVLVDYGHNPDAFEAIARMARAWRGRRVTAVIGVPGDRGDDLIAESGRVAARSFHRVLIKEDKDLRGRRKGEVAELLCKAVSEEAPGRECRVVPDETGALDLALRSIDDGDVVIVFYDKLMPVLATLEKHGARVASGMEEERQARFDGEEHRLGTQASSLPD